MYTYTDYRNVWQFGEPDVRQPRGRALFRPGAECWDNLHLHAHVPTVPRPLVPEMLRLISG